LTGLKWVSHSNYVDIGFAVDGRRAVIWSAIDNLVKGGAGQGIQCLNLMCGFPEDAGLTALPANP
jgi:N-acetyl-gamma-glutamyl-phosphate reductase